MSEHAGQGRYDAPAIEAKWRRRWEESGANSFSRERMASARKPFYNLMMFPYPSAEGLHVGNIYAFTGADVHGRFMRMRGFDVFEPIGFDAFGIHSENFALKTGVHPMDLIPSNIANFTRQLRRMGGMFDWRRTVDTTDPQYYRWTQWLFVRLFKRGLAVQKKAPVNWCPSCKTVLANEQVVQGQCERCSAIVEQRRIRQWFFRITRYADRLLANLDHIDWSESTLKAQRNWLGRSDGALLRFPLESGLGGREETIEVFTTRPDTVFGATFMALAPEHPLARRVAREDRRREVEAYLERTRRMDVTARRRESEFKTGVFTGAYCRNPASGRRVPIWIADYVLMDYGSGAVMGVPGHDQRDFEFAKNAGLEALRVIAPSEAEADKELVQAETGGGVLVRSGDLDGMESERAKRVIVKRLEAKGLAEAKAHYRIHDWCISRQRYWGPPIPIIHSEEHGPVAVPEEELPVLLPRVEDFRPDESGKGPLSRDPSWLDVACPVSGGPARRETDVSDTFLDSAWYFLRYPSADILDRPFDEEITRRWLPVDCYIGGNEHAVLHLLYARFLTMALHDEGLLEFEEPFSVFRAHGLIIRGGAKMSKSRGNVVVPDPIMERYGADTFRLYLMFLGPFTEGGDYQDKGIGGPNSFLHRLWDSVTVAMAAPAQSAADDRITRLLHRTIRKVTEDIQGLRYNTAIAAMMEYLNAARRRGRAPRAEELEPLVRLVAPFAPHIAEELWERMGGEGSVFDAGWPDFDAEQAARRSATTAAQVNGKLRGVAEVSAGASEEEVRAAAEQLPNVRRHLEGMELIRVVHVPDRLINFVVRPRRQGKK